MVIPSKRFIIFGTVISALAWSNFGIQTVLLNLAEPIFLDFINESLGEQFHLTPSSGDIAATFAILTSSTHFGIPIAVVIAHYGNIIGRKPVIMLIMPILTIVGSILMSAAFYANSIIPLILGRVVSGLSLLLTCFVAVPYVIEFTPKETKGFLPSFHSVYTQGWGLIIMILSLPEALGTARLWSWLVMVPILPSIVLLLAYIVAPESPGWLFMQKNDTDAARAALTYVYRHDDDTIEAVLNELSIEKDMGGSHSTIKQLLSDPVMLRSLILASIIGTAATVSGQTVISQFSTSIMIDIGLSNGLAEKVTIISQASNLLGSSICPALMRHFGYRTIFLGLLTLSFASGVGMYAFVALFDAGYLTDPLAITILTTTCLCVINLLHGAGLGPLSWFYMSELQMTSARTIANVILLVEQIIVIMIISFIFPVVLEKIGISAYPIVVSLPTFPLAVYLYFRLPETKNKSSAEIYHIVRRQAKSKSCFKVFTPCTSSLHDSESELSPLIPISD